MHPSCLAALTGGGRSRKILDSQQQVLGGGKHCLAFARHATFTQHAAGDQQKKDDTDQRRKYDRAPNYRRRHFNRPV